MPESAAAAAGRFAPEPSLSPRLEAGSPASAAG